MTDHRDTTAITSKQSLAVEDQSAGIAVPEDRVAECRARLDAVIRRFHGEVGSPLAALGLRLELIRGGKGLDPEVEVALDTVSAELGAVIDCVRESVAELRALERASRTLDSH
jgi:hypothetical protein